jgi:hypothetical protein
VFKAACAGYCVAVDAAAHTTVLLLTRESPGCKLQQTFNLRHLLCVCVCGTTVPMSYCTSTTSTVGSSLL